MRSESSLTVRLAKGENDLTAAKRLRYEVFVEEFGAGGVSVDHENRLESDRFDPWVDHLILVDQKRNAQEQNHVVGAYRLLRSEVAQLECGYYSSDEYDLSVLTESGRSLVELGRSCVHRDYRGGIGIFQLWRGLACYVLDNEIEVMFGVASFHGTDVDELGQALTLLHRNHLAPQDMRVKSRPEHYVSMDRVADGTLNQVQAMASVPPLIKAYLRLGGFVGDGAYVDHVFNTVDVCLVMDTTRMSERHRDHYIQVWEGQ